MELSRQQMINKRKFITPESTIFYTRVYQNDEEFLIELSVKTDTNCIKEYGVDGIIKVERCSPLFVHKIVKSVTGCDSEPLMIDASISKKFKIGKDLKQKFSDMNERELPSATHHCIRCFDNIEDCLNYKETFISNIL